MMELIKVGEKTYYIKNPTNIGVYKVNDTDIFISLKEVNNPKYIEQKPLE